MQIPPSGSPPLKGPFFTPPDLRPARDNTAVKPPVALPLEKIRLETQPTAAQTEIAFVEGHAPLSVKLTPPQFQKLAHVLERFPDLKADLEQLCAKPAGQPLLLARDRAPGLVYRGSLVSPPEPALWG